MSAEATQASGLLLPPHLTRVDTSPPPTDGDEKENSPEAEEGEKKAVQRSDGDASPEADAATAMQVEDDAAVADEAPKEETPGDVGAVESTGGEEANENVVPDVAEVNEAEATADAGGEKTADAGGEKTTARAEEAGGPSAPANPPLRGPISNSVADVRVYPGLPPHGLTEEQITELFDAVQRMK